MQTFWGLMTAYWRSGRWLEAWALSAVVFALTALSALAGVWFAEASGALVSAIAFLHRPRDPVSFHALLVSAATLAGIVILRDVGFTAVRHYFSTTLHRTWRGWLDRRFNEALLDANHTHFHLQRGADIDPLTGVPIVPDNIDQRVQESVKGMAGSAIGLAMGIAGVILSLLFVGRKIVATSVPVAGLERFGSYGSAVLTLLAVLAYVPVMTLVALKLGAVLEGLNTRMQVAEGSYRRELATVFQRGFSIAAAGGEAAQSALHRRRYSAINATWARLNLFTAGYMGFELIYGFFGSRIIAYAPGLLPYLDNTIGLQAYVTGAELANALIVDCSWFIHVMPDIATLRANSGRVTELAKAIEAVHDPDVFYGRTGVRAFRYERQDAALGLTLDGIELMQPGAAAPFVSTGRLTIAPGEWSLLCGESGSGKSSLLKAINGLWPHGRGTVLFPAGVRRLFAAQEILLPPISLKELVCMPDRPGDHSDGTVASALVRAGLAEFVPDLAAEGRNGQSWAQLLSGGERQKVVLARILLLKPGLLFLDEPTSALDPEAAIAFHEAIDTACPGATVISIMHDATPLRTRTGGEFYDSVLSLAHGTVTKAPLGISAGCPVGPARVQHRTP